MVEMLNTTSQFYANSHYDHHQIHEGNPKTTHQTIQPIENKSNKNKVDNNITTTKKLYHTISSATGRPLSDFFATLGSKTPTQYICDKFIKSDLLSNYDTLKQTSKNFPHTTAPLLSSTLSATSSTSILTNQGESNGLSVEGSRWNELNCLQGIYRNSKWEEEAPNTSELYEAVNINGQSLKLPPTNTHKTIMINKSSHNFLVESAVATNDNVQSGAILQNFQKLPECDQDMPKDTNSSGPSSSSSDLNGDNSVARNKAALNKLAAKIEQKKGSVRIYVDAAPIYSIIQNAANESASENSSSSIAATTTTTYSSSTVQRTSSASSSGEYNLIREANKKSFAYNANHHHQLLCSNKTDENDDRLQRRKMAQIMSSLEQQNKLLQRDLAREKKRRTEELARVVKSLLCFESKLKSDMKVVTERMQEKDVEICRLTRQNRALKKAYVKAQQEGKQTQDEGVVTDDSLQLELIEELDEHLLEDCLVLEALQCINCRKQFYDIGIKEGSTQTHHNLSESNVKNGDQTTEHGSSSDDTVSSSFYGARRSVRYTSKRTTGTFNDYMRSREMNVDDVINWENTSTLSRDSHTSTSSEKDNNVVVKPNSVTGEEDDGIFSPTQDDEDEEDDDNEVFEETDEQQRNSCSLTAAINSCVKTIEPRASEFSEASPKQIYETSADDWYASASDQDDIGDGRSTKGYTLAAVNPVLECVNQILLQQSMEEPVSDKVCNKGQTTQTNGNLPRRSSLSGRRSNGRQSESNAETERNKTLTRKRVHFSTKNSMVHLPRHETDNEDEQDVELPITTTNTASFPINLISSYKKQQTLIPCYPTTYFSTITPPSTQQQATMIKIAAATANERLETPNYESIYSNEYEPIGSERNSSSNLYVEMESECSKANKNNTTSNNCGTNSQDSRLVIVNNKSNSKKSKNNHKNHNKLSKTPPALPPKPANLIKFKKSTSSQQQQQNNHHNNKIKEEDAEGEKEEGNNSTVSEPDYCSISEINVGITSVQIVADVHKAPESLSNGDARSENENFDNLGELLDVADDMMSVVSDETCGAASQKTEEIEEIFADIPKLPNVAAIIGPKYQAKYQLMQQQQQQQQQLQMQQLKLQQQKQQQLLLHQSKTKSLLSDYLIMSPKNDSTSKTATITTSPTTSAAPQPFQAVQKQLINTSNDNSKLYNKTEYGSSPVTLVIGGKKIISNTTITNTPPKSVVASPTSTTTTTPIAISSKKINCILKDLEPAGGSLPLQEEFDWYNLDAEYGKATPGKSGKNEHKVQSNGVLSEIHEDHECDAHEPHVTTTADEYNLDEEFSLISEQPAHENVINIKGKNHHDKHINADMKNMLASLRAKKIHNNNNKNRETFEKFIEGSGLSTKPLPHKRKIYFAGPYV